MVKLATEEDVDVIGISSLATDHLIVPKLMTARCAPRAWATSGHRRRHRARRGREDAAGRRRRARVPPRQSAHLRSRTTFANHPHRAGLLSHRLNASCRSSRMNKPSRPSAGGQRRAGLVARGVRRADRHRPRGVQPLRIRSNRCTPRPTGTGPRDRADGLPGQAPHARHLRHHAPRAHVTQRQLTAWVRRREYNARLQGVLAQGATAVSLIPCNSVFRGYDMDESRHRAARHLRQWVINTAERMADRAPRASIPARRAMKSTRVRSRCSPSSSRRPGGAYDWRSPAVPTRATTSATTSPTMFFRIALPGARRILVDHIDYCNRSCAEVEPDVGGWPAHAAGGRKSGPRRWPSRLSTAIQTPGPYRPRDGPPTSSCRASPSSSTSRSVCSFEEVAKFRAGRRIWACVTRERHGARDPRSWRFKFHGQTSGGPSPASSR